MWNQLKTLTLLGALSALLIGIGGAVAPGHLQLFAGIAVLMNLGAYFFSDRIVLAMHRASEVSPEQAPELHRMLGELSAAAGIPRPRLFVIPEAQPNAFATGRNPAHAVVAVTQGIVQLLDARELRGVLAHELAHVKNRDVLVSSIAAAIAGTISYVANVLTFGALFGGRSDDDESPAGGLALALVAPIAATMIQLGISRAREFHADETGARLTGDPEALARALLKLERGAERIPVHRPVPATASLFIVNPLAGGRGMSRLFSTHPSTEERVRRLRSLPLSGQELPRPA